MLVRMSWPRRDAAPRVFLLYGPTGIGKTRLVNDRYPLGAGCFRKPPDTKWFDGYEGHKVLLLDDFSGAASKMSLAYLLQLLDRYEVSVEVKGDYVPLLATKIFVTTNIHPSLWYKWKNRESQYKALQRRFTAVLTLKNNTPFLLDNDKFWGSLTSTDFGDYSSSSCEWSEVVSAFPVGDL